MITLSIHTASLFIGFLLGYVLFSAIFLVFFYSKRWHDGFSEGWDAGMEYQRQITSPKEKEQ